MLQCMQSLEVKAQVIHTLQTEIKTEEQDLRHLVLASSHPSALDVELQSTAPKSTVSEDGSVQALACTGLSPSSQAG